MVLAFIKNRKLQIFFPFLLALLLTIPFFFLFPDLFPKYMAKLIESGFIDKPGGFEYYEDLDHDGFSERITLFNNTQNEASIKIVEEDGYIREHYYLKGETLKVYESCFFIDYDSTGTTRIVLFTLSHDSLLIHCIDPFGKKDFEFRAKFVAKVIKKNGTYDFQIIQTHFSDLDGDGNQELITTIMAGFPLKPRIGIVLDIARESLISSADRGMYFYINKCEDLNGDGQKELVTLNYSICNYPDSATGDFDDHKAEILVFDNRFNFLFQPVAFPGRYIHAHTYPVRSVSGKYQLVTLLFQTGTGDFYPRLILSDISGNRLAERKLPNIGKRYEYFLFFLEEYPDKIFLQNGRGFLEEVNADLHTVREMQPHESYASYRTSLDVDLDGRKERILHTGFGRVQTIYRNDFTHPVPLDYPTTAVTGYIGLKRMGANPPQVFIQHGDKYYFYTYGRNPLFFLKYPFYTGIFVGFLCIILLSQYIQRILITRQAEARKRIAALQLLVMNNQIDPHFTFNVISAISAAILNQRPEEANRSLLSLSWLMRSCVSHSDKLSRSLGEELNFVNHYLELMKNRMEGGFAFSIDVAPGIDLSWQVPKMVVQIYAENAVKHGLRPKGAGGQLKITVAGLPDDRVSGLAEGELQGSAHPHFATSLFHHFAIYIEDNGIGRKQAQLNGTSGTGKGLEIMEQFYATFNRYSRQKIRCEIIDLADDAGNALGTRVEITIPVGMKYAV